ncbi:Ribonuclease Z [uncultured archaeon]|nr:Ribonuclease Z [uncultured archaeon]
MAEKIRIVFLGTSASVPTKERNLSSIAIRFNGEWLLFDCPEGTQRQMVKAGVSYLKINHVFISHFHADHFLGLGGMLATMNIHGRDWAINIHGPRGIKEKVAMSMELAMLKPGFEVKCHEVKKGVVLKGDKFQVDAFPLKHEAECWGYNFTEEGKPGEFNREKAMALGIPVGPLFSDLQKGKSVKLGAKIINPEDVMDYSKAVKGKKISMVFDTLASKSYLGAIEGADVLVHEASFLDERQDRAEETMHSTALQAGKIAQQAGAKKLVLFHLSARHKDREKFENEARKEFNDVTVAEDLMEMEL